MNMVQDHSEVTLTGSLLRCKISFPNNYEDSTTNAIVRLSILHNISGLLMRGIIQIKPIHYSQFSIQQTGREIGNLRSFRILYRFPS